MSYDVRNILFIMCDQLRFDYLSAYGHPALDTPNIDELARRGVRFDRAYVQSPICGSSRMSFYTGRYVHSHGASWNTFPIRVGEPTLGDHMRELGRETVLVGKTHMRADLEGLARLEVDQNSIQGVRAAECGFDPWDRDDGLHGDGPDGRYDPKAPNYNNYLRQQGYDGPNQWHRWANAVVDDAGQVRSGFLLANNRFPSRLPDEHTETPYMTRRAIEYMEHAGNSPWCMHLSYIKPHWPCVAPAPYHAMFGREDILPIKRAAREREDPHPILASFQQRRVSRAFSQPEIRNIVIPAYMGLVKQIDDQLGILFDYMKDKDLFDKTLVVFTSDHGDYLGDHWLGEKDFFHEASVRVPMIVVDPRQSADTTRGTSSDALVEGIDLVPTFVDACGGEAKPHQLDGRSLIPILDGSIDTRFRDFVVSEYDYSMLPTATQVDTNPRDCRLFMVYDGRFKYIHAIGLRPLLFDLENDPDEFIDLGRDPAMQPERERLHRALGDWALRNSQRVTVSDAEIERRRGGSVRRGILIGYNDESELPSDVREHLVAALND